MRRFGGSLFVGLVVGVALAAPAHGLAASGEITRATVSADGSAASLAGSVQWSGCGAVGKIPHPEYPWESPWEKEPLLQCDWSPYLTVAPGVDPADCSKPARHLASLGEDVTLAWAGGERFFAASLSFDVEGIPLSGSGPQLACLSAVGQAPQPVICIQVYPSPCPKYKLAGFFDRYGAAPLTTPPTGTPPVEGSTIPVSATPVPAPPATRKAKCRKGKVAKHRGSRKCGKRPGRHKQGAHK